MWYFTLELVPHYSTIFELIIQYSSYILLLVILMGRTEREEEGNKWLEDDDAEKAMFELM